VWEDPGHHSENQTFPELLGALKVIVGVKVDLEVSTFLVEIILPHRHNFVLKQADRNDALLDLVDFVSAR
jgi:hypothetical protein